MRYVLEEQRSREQRLLAKRTRLAREAVQLYPRLQVAKALGISRQRLHRMLEAE